MSAQESNWIDEVISEVLPGGLGGRDVVLDDLPSVSTLTERSLDLLRNAAGQPQGRLDDWLFGPHRTMQASMTDAMLLVGMGLMRRQPGRLSGQANFYVTDAGREVLAEAERPAREGELDAVMSFDDFLEWDYSSREPGYKDRFKTWLLTNKGSEALAPKTAREWTSWRTEYESATFEAARRPVTEQQEAIPIEWFLKDLVQQMQQVPGVPDHDLTFRGFLTGQGVNPGRVMLPRQEWETHYQAFREFWGILTTSRRVKAGSAWGDPWAASPADVAGLISSRIVEFQGLSGVPATMEQAQAAPQVVLLVANSGDTYDVAFAGGQFTFTPRDIAYKGQGGPILLARRPVTEADYSAEASVLGHAKSLRRPGWESVRPDEEGSYRERRLRRLQSSIPTLHDRVKWVLSSTSKPGLTADLVGAALEMSTAEAAEILAALVQKGEVEELAAGVFRMKATVKRSKEADQADFAEWRYQRGEGHNPGVVDAFQAWVSSNPTYGATYNARLDEWDSLFEEWQGGSGRMSWGESPRRARAPKHRVGQRRIHEVLSDEILFQYEYIRREGLWHMGDKNGIQRRAYELRFYELVTAAEEDYRAVYLSYRQPDEAAYQNWLDEKDLRASRRRPVREQAGQVNFATFVSQSPLSVQEADVFWDWLGTHKGIEGINVALSLDEWSDLLTEFGESEYGGGFYGPVVSAGRSMV